MRQTNQSIMADVSDVVKSKRIANNTVKYERANGDVVYRLHNTDVVTKHADGTFTLNSGGWKTVTTKDRINLYAPAHLYSGDGTWYVGRVPFFDGMRITADGKVIDADENKGITLAKKAKALKAKITKFVRMIDDCDELPTPDGGDCWLCMIHGEKARDNKSQLDFNTIKNQTGPTDNVNHLMSHIDEGYLHGTLLVNAMRWKGYSDEGISIYYGMAQRGERHGRDVFKRALRGYLGRKLGLVIR